MTASEFEVHPLASVFPSLENREFDDLVADIKATGLKEPILMLDGKVLDGRNRQAACHVAGVTPRFVEYTGDDPVSEVISRNIHRRHLTKKQKAQLILVAVKLGTIAGSVNVVDRPQGGGSQPGERAKAIGIAEQQGVSARTVDDAIAESKPKRKRKPPYEPPPYEPPPDEQATLDNLEKGLSKLSEYTERTGVANILIKLDGIEKRRWLEMLQPVCKCCKRLALGAKV